MMWLNQCSTVFFFYNLKSSGLTLHPLYENSDDEEGNEDDGEIDLDVPTKKFKSSNDYAKTSTSSKSNKITDEKFPTCR